MNIVYILNDHQAFYGHDKAKRPVFDQFAAEGVRFDRAYCASPLCAPARRSMLTSMYPHNHGEIKNDVDAAFKDGETYLDVLAANGYDQYYFGKWHAGPGTAYDHGCKGFSYPSYNNPYTKPEYKAYLDEMGLKMPEIFIEDDMRSWTDTHEGKVVHQDNHWCNEHASGIMMGPKEAHEAFFLANLAKKQLKELKKGGKPFHLRVDFWGPHQPYFPTWDFAEQYNPSDIDLPISFKENVYTNNKPACYTAEHNKGISKDGRIIFPNPLCENIWKRMLARCYAQVSLVDAAAGIILDALREYGLEEDTLVMMTTDHGDGLACHGGHFDKVSYMPEEMIRIPMAMRCPGKIPPRRVSHHPVSNMDVGITMLDAAGLAYDHKVDGSSLMGIAADENAPFRKEVVCETHGHMEDHIGRAFITETYKFVYNKDQINELYDLKSDPWELRNLAVLSDYEDICSDMLKRLQQWGQETGDLYMQL